MDQGVLGFYDSLAAYYHLIFEDWDSAIERQRKVLDSLLKASLPARPLRILDCACGIGTQSIGFARSGHVVTASDLSEAAVVRARQEVMGRGVEVRCLVSDMTAMLEIEDSSFDVVAAMDNALPHLSAGQVRQAIRTIGSKLKPGGLFLASIRDYDELLTSRPTMQPPAFYGEAGRRRIVHQVWDWLDATRYIVHLHITEEAAGAWTTRHFACEYRCIVRGELASELEMAGFHDVRWIMPEESGYYQPIALARWGQAG